jgi:hypothetical protein
MGTLSSLVKGFVKGKEKRAEREERREKREERREKRHLFFLCSLLFVPCSLQPDLPNNTR